VRPIVITAEVDAPGVDVFSVLGDVANHSALSCRRAQLVEVSQDRQGRMLGVIDALGPWVSSAGLPPARSCAGPVTDLAALTASMWMTAERELPNWVLRIG
jgi:hypothetical protein